MAFSTLNCGYKVFLLIIVDIKGSRAVLRSDVGTLLIKRGGVVNEEENIKNDIFGDNFFIEPDPHGFGVSGCAQGNLMIARIRDIAARIACYDFGYAFQSSVDGV